jgi:cysteine desulfurase
VELTAETLCQQFGVELCLVPVEEKGNIQLSDLEELLKDPRPTLVSLMHANNEIATLIDLHQIGDLCKKYGAFFHSDTVQTMAHYEFNLKETPIDFVTCAGHKFHGPKGSGFLFVRSGIPFQPMTIGGSQERGYRAGTECIHNIAGLAKAFDLAYTDLAAHQNHVQGLKSKFMAALMAIDENITFNGETTPEKSLYTVLNVSFPPSDKVGLLLFALDLKGIACSGGSACSAGANTGSHVMNGIKADASRANIRFSFSRYNTEAEIDFALKVIEEAIVC